MRQGGFGQGKGEHDPHGGEGQSGHEPVQQEPGDAHAAAADRRLAEQEGVRFAEDKRAAGGDLGEPVQPPEGEGPGREQDDRAGRKRQRQGTK